MNGGDTNSINTEQVYLALIMTLYYKEEIVRVISWWLIFQFGFEPCLCSDSILFSQLLHWQLFIYTCYSFCSEQNITQNFPLTLLSVTLFAFSFHSMKLIPKTHSLRNNLHKILTHRVSSLTVFNRNDKWLSFTFEAWFFFHLLDFWCL